MKRNFTLLLVFMLCAFLSFGQSTKRADKAFDNGEYYKAIEEYTLIQEHVTDPATKSHIRFRMAESYRRMNRPEKAEKFYVDAIKAGFMSPEVYLGYGMVLMKQAKYEEAQKALESYKRSNPSDKYADVLIASTIFARENTAVNPQFTLQPLEALNTRGSEYGIAYFNDALIYASTGSTADDGDTKSKKDVSDKISLRTGLGYSRFYMSVPIEGNYAKGEEAIGLNTNKRMNQGTFSYDPTSRYGYYTRCEGSDNQCYIYFAEFKNNQWKEKDRLLVESRKMPIGHPFITQDGQRIYFVSTMEGGYGRSDIWYMDKLPDGTWSKPINLGREVNTVGNESFPFAAGGYLFFTSDGHPGYGGTDIFASKMDGNIHGEAFNLGLPFNSASDDLNLIQRADLEEGMLVSTRRGEKSSDDIFRYKGFPSSLMASGRIYDSVMNQPLAGATLEVLKDGKIVEKLTSNDSGRYSFFVMPEGAYQITSTVLGFNPASKSYTASAERFGRLQGWDLPLINSEAFISGVITAYEEKNNVRKELGPLVGATVVLYENGKQVKVIRSKANGEYRFGGIKENAEYLIKAVMPEHFVDTKTLFVGKITRSIDFCKETGHDMDLALRKVVKEQIKLDNILYDYAKATLRPESMIELDKLVVMLNKNPQFKIQISSHTDSRGSAKANDKLSLERAKSVVDYLVSKGINPARLTSMGYGKKQLLVKNAKTEAQHQENRRTTFMIIGETGAALYDTEMQVSESASNTPHPYAGGQLGAANSNNFSQQSNSNIAQPPTTGVNYQDYPYRVQLSASKSLDLNKPEFHRITAQFNLPVYAELSNGMYRYFAGGFNTMEEAKAMADRLNAAFKTQYFAKAK